MYKYIKNYLSGIKNPVIFELGVHYGEDTQRLYNFCKPYKYFGFEPDPYNISIAREKCSQFENLTLIHGAISSEDGESDFHTSGGIHPNGNIMKGAGSLREPKQVVEIHKWMEFNKIKVKTFTIDKFCEDQSIDHIDFIWSDLQGCEYDMLIGARKMLPNIKLMLLEYSYKELYEGQKNLDEIMELLGDRFNIVEKTNMDVLVINSDLSSK